MTKKYYLDIHEKDYGEPAFGDMIIGAAQLIWSVVSLLFTGVVALYYYIKERRD